MASHTDNMIAPWHDIYILHPKQRKICISVLWCIRFNFLRIRWRWRLGYSSFSFMAWTCLPVSTIEIYYSLRKFSSFSCILYSMLQRHLLNSPMYSPNNLWINWKKSVLVVTLTSNISCYTVEPFSWILCKILRFIYTVVPHPFTFYL